MRRNGSKMLQRVEQIEIDLIKKVLKHATGPSEVSLIKAVSLCSPSFINF